MEQCLDNFDIDKLLQKLNIRSFEFKTEDRDLIFLRRYNTYWKDTGFLIKTINQKEYFNFLRKRVSQIMKENIYDKLIIENKIENKQFSNLSNTDFRIYRFVRHFQESSEKGIIKIIGNLNYENVICTSDDRNCCLTFYRNIANMFDTAISVHLPRKMNNTIKTWYPKEKEARKILESQDKVGYNYETLSKAHEIFNHSAQGYVSQTTHLMLRKLNLVILISARNIEF